MAETEYPLPNIKCLPGDKVCVIKGRMIIMARIACVFYNTDVRKYKFLIDKFAKEYTEDELFFNFHDAQKFMDGEDVND